MALSLVTLKWDVADMIQAGIAATLTIAPTAQLSDTTDHVLIPSFARQVTFSGGTGQLAGIVANDSANVLPAGTGYLISVTAQTGQVIVPQFQTQILEANGSTQWLDQLAIVPVVTAGQQYLPLKYPTGAFKGYVWTSADDVGTGGWGPSGGATVQVPAPAGATAEDTPAVQAAITNLAAALAFGPASLQFQDGIYQVDSNSLVIRSLSGFAVRGTGATLIEQAPNRTGLPNNTGGDVLVIADSTDFRVENIEISGARDTVAPLIPLTATAASGQKTVTVAAGAGAYYPAGSRLLLFGGLTSSDQALYDGWDGYGGVQPALIVGSVTPGGGSGGGDLITFTANLANSYTQISATLLSDAFGPYACEGAYLTPYQTGNLTVAGRTLAGEDQQCGLHLISCQRFTLSAVTAGGTWESPIKCGTGFATSSLTDGCSYGTITDGCFAYHGYDQGISLWVSDHVTVTGCRADSAGWAGICMTGSDYCNVVGNQVARSVYRVPTDPASGSGIVTEGGLRNVIKGNVVNSPNSHGVMMLQAPLWWGLLSEGTDTTNNSYPAFSSYLAPQTAAGTSIQVSATSTMIQGGRYSILDGPRSEAVTVASIVDGTHVEFQEEIQFPHASGTLIVRRLAQENLVEGNTIRSAGTYGVNCTQSARNAISGNTISGYGAVEGSGARGIDLTYSTLRLPSGSAQGGDGSTVQGNIIGGGAGPGIECNGVSALLVSGNRVYQPNSSGASIDLQGVTDSVITGNQAAYNRGSNGISVKAGGPATTACARLSITANRVAFTQLEGILVVAGDSLVIEGNQVQSCGGNAGIDLRGVSNSLVSGNVSNSNESTGILLENNSSTGCLHNRVTGNTCRDDGTGQFITFENAAWIQQHGIVESGNSNDNMFRDNACDSNAVDQLTTVGAGSVQRDNIISGVLVKQAEPAAFLPSNPTDTASTTLVMMGMGGTCVYTPSGSGKVLVAVSGFGYQGGASVNSIGLGPRYGTGTAPANGAAVTGTRFGCTTDPEIRPSATGIGSNGLAFGFTALLALTPGTAYWFDIAALTTNTSEPSALQNISMTFAELP